METWIIVGLLIIVFNVITLILYRLKSRKKVNKGQLSQESINSDYDYVDVKRLRLEGKLKAQGKMPLTSEDIKDLKEIGIHINDLGGD